MTLTELIEYFPIDCRTCSQVVWINPMFYKDNYQAEQKDICPYCDYPKYYSLWDFAGKHRDNKNILQKFRLVDFFLAQTLKKMGKLNPNHP